MEGKFNFKDGEKRDQFIKNKKRDIERYKDMITKTKELIDATELG